MMDTDKLVRLVLWVPRDLHRARKDAAERAGEPVPDALRARLASSLTVDNARSGAEMKTKEARA